MFTVLLWGPILLKFGIIRVLLHHPRRRTLLLSLKLKNIHLICLSSQKERKRKHFVSQLGTEQASPFASTRLCLTSTGKETTAAFFSCYPQHSLVLVFCLKGAILPSHGEQVAVPKLFFFLGRWIPMCNCPALTDSHNILLLCLPEMGPSESQSRVCYIQEYFLQSLLQIKIKSKWIGGRG